MFDLEGVSAEQIEDDEIHGVALRCERLRLHSSASDAHSTPHDISPSFLRDDLEQYEKRIAEIVEADNKELLSYKKVSLKLKSLLIRININ